MNHRRLHLLPAPIRGATLAGTIAVGLTLAGCARTSPATTAGLPSDARSVATNASVPVAETTLVTTTTDVTVGTESATDSAGLANPASVFCVESGGKLEIRTDPTGGQLGVCVFGDGTQCEEWAFYRGECQPGRSGTIATPAIAARFASAAYGFTLDAPADWTIEEETNNVIFRKGDYFLFVGFKRADEEVGPFRTGMPAGDFEPDGRVLLLGQDLPKTLLVLEGNTKVVEYAAGVGVGELRLYAWLDGNPPPEDYMTMDIPADIIAEADAIIASFALASGETPELKLPPTATP